MQLTLLKVIAVLTVGFNVSFPWWFWLWALISEFNGLLYSSLDYKIMKNMDSEFERENTELKGVIKQ